MAQIKCFLVVPCYRESRRLPPFLTDLCRAASVSPHRIEIQVVDDGSGAAERSALSRLVTELRLEHPMLREPILLERNEGKGKAIRSGWATAPSACPYLGFVDADGAVPASEVMMMIGIALGSTREALFLASRRLPGSRAKRYWHRRLMSAVFAAATRLRYGIQVADTQCGCKLAPRRLWEKAGPSFRQDRFGLDIELVIAAQELEIPCWEVPIAWLEKPGSKLSLRRAAGLLMDVLRKRI